MSTLISQTQSSLTAIRNRPPCGLGLSRLYVCDATWTLHSQWICILINQGRNPEKAIMVTSSAANTCCSPAVGCASLPSFLSHSEWFPLNHNNPKVLKHINRWVSPAYKGPSGWLLWPCPTAADTSFSDKSNLAVTRGLASLKKYWG